MEKRVNTLNQLEFRVDGIHDTDLDLLAFCIIDYVVTNNDHTLTTSVLSPVLEECVIDYLLQVHISSSKSLGWVGGVTPKQNLIIMFVLVVPNTTCYRNENLIPFLVKRTHQ